MAENAVRQEPGVRKIRHRGRMSQVPIYLGKQLRFFINQNDWKVLPMAAVIAALVGMVIRSRLFINMEGSLMGSFALTCVAIWNGCFNSIQAVCRERPIIKREHRSGMHISAYVAAHMIYQLLLCTAQTGISLYVLMIVGVQFPVYGPITGLMIADIGITMLLICYAADMMSLLISSVAHTTTGAMTVMPFVLIFQLVFSGGIIPLPAWSRPISDYTISNYGIRALAAQSGYNDMPMVTAWNTLEKMKDKEIDGSMTVGEILDFLNRPENETLAGLKDMVILPEATEGEAADMIPLGEAIDLMASSPLLTENRDKTLIFHTTVGKLIDLAGEEKVRELVQRTTAEASYNEEYATTPENIIGNWMTLGAFIVFFALMSMAALKLIDKDKR